MTTNMREYDYMHRNRYAPLVKPSERKKYEMSIQELTDEVNNEMRNAFAYAPKILVKEKKKSKRLIRPE